MCTALSFISGKHYFGRNLDLAYHYQEAVTITPWEYPFNFRYTPHHTKHFAIIGIATIANDYPLYYDGTNEAGLSMAGLNFPGNAFYGTENNKAYTIAPFEFIPWILCQCRTVKEAVTLLESTQLCNQSFSPDYPVTDLHWIISDSTQSITVEPGKTGLQIYDNPVHVLTNNPPFDYHMHNLQNYHYLSNQILDRGMLSTHSFTPYSNGLGAWGLPGDYSSASRFVRTVFTAKYSKRPTNELAAVNQFIRILGSVSQIEGCTKEEHGYTKTVYTSCCDTACGKYYYTTYENPAIRCVRFTEENKKGKTLAVFPLDWKKQVSFIN